MDNFKTPSKVRENVSQKLLSIPPSPFLEKLGYGTGVNVWKMQPSPKNNHVRSPWAIKNIRKNINVHLSSKYQSLISKEANILKSLNHENIVGFRGYLKSEDGRDCLAMEIGGKSLGNMIEDRFEDALGPYPVESILKLAYGVAKALKYLHEDKKILHGDIKSYNIVVKDNFEEVKLCDFGMSLSLDDEDIKKKYVGTAIYSAPECQEGADGPITAKSDIFSFGLVLWEMISLCPPHITDLLLQESFCDSDLNESEFDLEESYVSKDEFEENYGTRPALPPVDLGPEYKPIIEIFYCCTEQEPEKRPTSSYLVQHLEFLMKS